MEIKSDKSYFNLKSPGISKGAKYTAKEAFEIIGPMEAEEPKRPYEDYSADEIDELEIRQLRKFKRLRKEHPMKEETERKYVLSRLPLILQRKAILDSKSNMTYMEHMERQVIADETSWNHAGKVDPVKVTTPEGLQLELPHTGRKIKAKAEEMHRSALLFMQADKTVRVLDQYFKESLQEQRALEVYRKTMVAQSPNQKRKKRKTPEREKTDELGMSI